jgi:hypothetical protein
LVRRGRVEDAKKSLSRLTSPTCGIPIDIDREISIIQATTEQDIFLSHGAGLTDCFKGVNIRRTEIVIVAWMIQTLCGFGLVSYAVVFLEQAGLSQTNSFSFNIGIFGLGWLGTLGAFSLPEVEPGLIPKMIGLNLVFSEYKLINACSSRIMVLSRLDRTPHSLPRRTHRNVRDLGCDRRLGSLQARERCQLGYRMPTARTSANIRYH